jgi:hypothetical protein
MAQQQTQGGAPGAGGAKAPKVDINTVATDVFQLKKMMFSVFQRMGLEMPPDLLDGPNRDPQTGMPSVAPTGGSTPAGGGQAGAGQPLSAIQPIEPMQGAFPSGPGGGGQDAGGKSAGIGKVGSSIPVTDVNIVNSPVAHAQALAAMFARRS